MIATDGTAGRALASFARQVGVSVLATLGATAVLAGFGALHLPSGVNLPAPSILTSGGKYATRAAETDDANDLVTLVNLPLVLPLFTATAVPALDPALATGADALRAALDAPQRIVATRPGRTAARRVAAPLPPRRDHEVAATLAMASLPDVTASSLPTSLWGDVKSTYGKMTAWSGAVLDHLTP